MSRFKMLLVSLFSIAIVLGGCSAGNGADNTKQQSDTSENISSENQEESVTISITKNKGEETLAEKEVEIQNDAILYDVMKENFEIKDDAGFITSINGIEAKESEKMAWMFSVNDEMASLGAKELKLSPGDTVNFDLQSWE